MLPIHSPATILTDPSIQLGIDIAGQKTRPVVIWLADPLALQTKECWDSHFTGPLASSFRLVRYDLRGTGESSKSEDPDVYSLIAQARDLRAIAGTFGCAQIAIVAAGWAGAVVAEYLRQFVPTQHNLIGLVFLGAITHINRYWRPLAYQGLESRARWLSSPDNGIRRLAVEGYLRDGYAPGALSQEHWQQMVSTALIPPPGAVRALFDAFEAWIQSETPTPAAGFPIPTLICHGEQDRLVDLKSANIAVAHFPLSHVIHYPGLGHGLANEPRPARDIQQFLHSVI